MALIIYKGVTPDEHGEQCVSRYSYVRVLRTNPSGALLKTVEDWRSINMSVGACHIKAPPLGDSSFLDLKRTRVRKPKAVVCPVLEYMLKTEGFACSFFLSVLPSNKQKRSQANNQKTSK
jgi:hypothetical protein